MNIQDGGPGRDGHLRQIISDRVPGCRHHGVQTPHRGHQAVHCVADRSKGGSVDMIVWAAPTARLLGGYLADRTGGPLFLTLHRSRTAPPGP